MIKVHVIEEYPDYYKFIGYVDQHSFLAKIEKESHEITDLKYTGSIRSIVIQNAIVQCCLSTLFNGLVKPNRINPSSDTKKPENTTDLALSILKRYGKQGSVDYYRETIVAS